MSYSIIIPVYNEFDHLPDLLIHLKELSINHEIIIVDDGSIDGSSKLLYECPFITTLKLKNNSGKGIAIRTGIKSAKNNNIIIMDGDLELNPLEINKLMILNKNNPNKIIIGTRYKNIAPFNSLLTFGNFFFTGLFNLIYRQNITDALCCAKAFNKMNFDFTNLKSTGFDIDIEIAINLTKNKSQFIEIPLTYKRRGKLQGKKLNFSDSWIILKRMIQN